MMEFPKVFTEEDFEYKNRSLDKVKASACADGLVGWAICMTGVKPPKGFGEGMVKISMLLGVSATSESLNEYANNYLKAKA